MSHLLLSLTIGIFEAKADFLKGGRGHPTDAVDVYHREGVLWCISILTQMNVCPDPFLEAQMLQAKYLTPEKKEELLKDEKRSSDPGF